MRFFSLEPLLPERPGTWPRHLSNALHFKRFLPIIQVRVIGFDFFAHLINGYDARIKVLNEKKFNDKCNRNSYILEISRHPCIAS
jgi:hypothetical protein